MKFICDLDGTIIDSTNRIYTLFSNLIHPKLIQYERFISDKRAGKSNDLILKTIFGYKTDHLSNFQKQWSELIESRVYIKYNVLFPFSIEALSILKSFGEIYLVSNRQKKDVLLNELQQLGLWDFFSLVLATEHKKTKVELIIEQNIINNKADLYMIGDTGEDIIAAKDLGIKSVAVKSGHRNELCLRSYQPDYIFENLSSFTDFIKNNNWR
ncbi:HAD family hydrolase [Bacteroidota bacterium]